LRPDGGRQPHPGDGRPPAVADEASLHHVAPRFWERNANLPTLHPSSGGFPRQSPGTAEGRT
jgi:hypothetical protein